MLALVPEGGGQELKVQLEGLAYNKARTLALLDNSGKELARLGLSTENGVAESDPFNLPPGLNWLTLVSLDGADVPALVAPPDSPSKDNRSLSALLYNFRIKNKE